MCVRSSGGLRQASVTASSASIAASSRSRSSGERDLGDDLAEEAADDEPAGHVLGDAAALQVEQLLVVEPPGRAGVAGTGDLPGLDLEVGHRVGAGVLGEHEVAVELERLGLLGGGADQHVADPDGVGTVALQGVLVVHVGPAVRHRVVDQQPLLDVLAGVGEPEAEQLDVAAGSAVGHRRAGPDEVAAEGDGDGAQARVAADRDVLGADVHGVVGPLLGHHQREPRPLGQHDLEVVGERAGAAVLDHDRRLGVRGGAQVQVRRRGRALARDRRR